jgi:hypothetical protein
MARLVLRHTSEAMIDSWYTHDDLDNLRAAVAHIEF